MFHVPCSRSAARPRPVALSPSSLSSSLFLPGEQSPHRRVLCPILTVSSSAAEMLPGNSSQGLSQSCISTISIVMPPSVSMNKAETALRMKGRKGSWLERSLVITILELDLDSY